MKRLFLVVGSFLSIFGLFAPSYAEATRAISASMAQGHGQILTVDLYPGHGTTLNFRPSGEAVRKVWLDDPSQVTVDFDDASCSTGEAKARCAASVIHLRRIKRLHFPDLPITATTSLTVLTDRKLYKFRLAFPNSGSPNYYTIEIQPDQTVQSPALTGNQISGQPGAQLIEKGLLTAQSRNLIAQGDALWSRVRSLLQLIRQGVPVSEAAGQVGVSQALLMRLAELGTVTNPR